MATHNSVMRAKSFKRSIFIAIETNDVSRLKKKTAEEPYSLFQRLYPSDNTPIHCLAGVSASGPLTFRYGPEPSKKVVHLLLSEIPFVDVENIWGETALSIAARTNYIYVAEKLVQKGANPNHKPHHGQPPLHAMITSNYVFDSSFRLGESLIKAGANINGLNFKGQSPLSHLIYTHLIHTSQDPVSVLYQKIMWLLKHGAKVDMNEENLLERCEKNTTLSPSSIQALVRLLRMFQSQKKD